MGQAIREFWGDNFTVVEGFLPVFVRQDAKVRFPPRPKLLRDDVSRRLQKICVYLGDQFPWGPHPGLCPLTVGLREWGLGTQVVC